MAFPRVFVSSTCYDLGEIRDSLVSFINSYSYEPVLSERGDIFYHPDLHTHESCIQEIENCQLFLLIIGGRFGGEYVADRKKSIVNAEYQASRQSDIPVFCFVKKEVLEDHRLYEKNKGDKDLVGKILFPSIEQHEYAIDIFEFIDEVRNSPVNNGIFPFDFGRDIQDILKKQWAGMMFDFLTKRRMQKELEMARGLIGNLTLASKKTEELLERVYVHLDKDEAEESISQLDKELDARKFFQEILGHNNLEKFDAATLDTLMSIDSTLPWYRFLEKTGEFEISERIPVQGEHRKVDLVTNSRTSYCFEIGGDMSKKDKDKFEEFTRLFNAFRELTSEQKKKVLADFVH